MEPEREEAQAGVCVRERGRREEGGEGGAREGGWGRGAGEEEEGRREEEQGGAGGGERHTEAEELGPSGGGEREEGARGGDWTYGENMRRQRGCKSSAWKAGLVGARGPPPGFRIRDLGFVASGR